MGVKHLQRFERRSRIDAPASLVFAWHLRPGAFERLLPPGDGTRVLQRTGSIEADDMRVELQVPVLGPVRQRWVVRHEGYEPGRRFVDVMERGPFRYWRHEHLVEPIGEEACELVDSIEFAVPGGVAGRGIGGRIVRAKLDPMFVHRHAVTRDDVLAISRSLLVPSIVRVEREPGASVRSAEQVAAFLLLAGHDVRSSTVVIQGVDLHAGAARPDATVLVRRREFEVAARSARATVEAADDVAAPRDLLSVLEHVLAA